MGFHKCRTVVVVVQNDIFGYIEKSAVSRVKAIDIPIDMSVCESVCVVFFFNDLSCSMQLAYIVALSTAKNVICECNATTVQIKCRANVLTFIGQICMHAYVPVIHLNLKRPDKYNLSFTHYLSLEMISRFWSARMCMWICLFLCICWVLSRSLLLSLPTCPLPLSLSLSCTVLFSMLFCAALLHHPLHMCALDLRIKYTVHSNAYYWNFLQKIYLKLFCDCMRNYNMKAVEQNACVSDFVTVHVKLATIFVFVVKLII